MPQRRALTNGRSLSASSHPVCVPKTSSVLIARPNRLNVSGDDRALLAPPGPVRLTVQVKERTCGRERCAPTSIDCAAAEGARSRSRSSGTAASCHMLSSVDCITTTSESEFSVHTMDESGAATHDPPPPATPHKKGGEPLSSRPCIGSNFGRWT
jgi:hypothetical protein